MLTQDIKRLLTKTTEKFILKGYELRAYFILFMIVCSKPASVPSSPVEGKNQIMRTTSNPFFVPMRKEPPNYDDAVKNLANKVHVIHVVCLEQRLVFQLLC